VPNLGLSVHLNACLVLGNTTPECYFYHSTNKTFHDLTNGRSMPAAATSILGMGMKFIPTPQWTPHPDVVNESIDRFECDLGLKVFFAGDEDITKTPEKLRVKSTWRAPLPPRRVDLRICKFARAVKHILTRRRGRPNLTKFQRGVLGKIRDNHDVIIAHADKGLGPVGVETSKYIRWALKSPP
jgi:hypothetical protein